MRRRFIAPVLIQSTLAMIDASEPKPGTEEQDSTLLQTQKSGFAHLLADLKRVSELDRRGPGCFLVPKFFCIARKGDDKPGKSGGDDDDRDGDDDDDDDDDDGSDDGNNNGGGQGNGNGGNGNGGNSGNGGNNGGGNGSKGNGGPGGKESGQPNPPPLPPPPSSSVIDPNSQSRPSVTTSTTGNAVTSSPSTTNNPPTSNSTPSTSRSTPTGNANSSAPSLLPQSSSSSSLPSLSLSSSPSPSSPSSLSSSSSSFPTPTSNPIKPNNAPSNESSSGTSPNAGKIAGAVIGGLALILLVLLGLWYLHRRRERDRLFDTQGNFNRDGGGSSGDLESHVTVDLRNGPDPSILSSSAAAAGEGLGLGLGSGGVGGGRDINRSGGDGLPMSTVPFAAGMAAAAGRNMSTSSVSPLSPHAIAGSGSGSGNPAELYSPSQRSLPGSSSPATSHSSFEDAYAIGTGTGAAAGLGVGMALPYGQGQGQGQPRSQFQAYTPLGAGGSQGYMGVGMAMPMPMPMSQQQLPQEGGGVYGRPTPLQTSNPVSRQPGPFPSSGISGAGPGAETMELDGRQPPPQYPGGAAIGGGNNTSLSPTRSISPSSPLPVSPLSVSSPVTYSPASPVSQEQSPTGHFVSGPGVAAVGGGLQSHPIQQQKQSQIPVGPSYDDYDPSSLPEVVSPMVQLGQVSAAPPEYDESAERVGSGDEHENGRNGPRDPQGTLSASDEKAALASQGPIRRY